LYKSVVGFVLRADPVSLRCVTLLKAYRYSAAGTTYRSLHKWKCQLHWWWFGGRHIYCPGWHAPGIFIPLYGCRGISC